MELKVPLENDETKTEEDSLTMETLLFAFNLDPDSTLVGYPRYAEQARCLHRQRMKVKRSLLLVTDAGC